jgi:hypothetical protein
VTDPGQSASGDYGYDLAHEDMAHEVTTHLRTGREKAPGERPGEHAGPSPASREGENNEDMSYDEAHDF